MRPTAGEKKTSATVAMEANRMAVQRIKKGSLSAGGKSSTSSWQ